MKPLLTLAFFVIICTSISMAVAMPGGDQSKGSRMEHRLQKMIQNLNLTDEQHEQMRALMESHQKERQELHKKMQKNIKAMLNSEQLVKYKTLHEARKNTHKGKWTKRRRENNCHQQSYPNRNPEK